MESCRKVAEQLVERPTHEWLLCQVSLHYPCILTMIGRENLQFPKVSGILYYFKMIAAFLPLLKLNERIVDDCCVFLWLALYVNVK